LFVAAKLASGLDKDAVINVSVEQTYVTVRFLQRDAQLCNGFKKLFNHFSHDTPNDTEYD